MTDNDAARELAGWIAEEGAQAEFRDPEFLRCFAEELIDFINDEEDRMNTINVNANHIARAISLAAQGDIPAFLRTPGGRELEALYSRALGQPHDPAVAKVGERVFAELLEREPGIAISEPESERKLDFGAAYERIEAKARELFSKGEAKSMGEALEVAQQRRPDLVEAYSVASRESAARACAGQ